MKLLAAATLALVVSQVSAEQPESWLRAPATNINTAKIVKPVPRDYIFEVPVSLFDMAMEELRAKPIVPLQSYDVDSFSRWHFSCPRATSPYLVRAVYSNGGTGGYHLQQVDSSLWVGHASLGASSGEHRSALLACLDFQPSQVFVLSSGAI
ncbi:hypothetical protein OCJ37_01905 [Xanthomonas sp. AM6]|uniref:hypothetical protein n=1 Tax=Xanthomonas sp. AM6 TaxID=2982531 RepID=UPI0021D86E8B|nr:hypothetical protein [Xanthomonas sp. AM6]UYB52746.1 hypothetical protein OCJ37_01905 [Xanthomonas sp. AM6]